MINYKTTAAAALMLLNSGALFAKKQPNIVMLFVDDLGWADLGYQNPRFNTPNVDELRNEGVYFSRTYISTATSSPSRASLLTGKEALRCGFVRHIYDNPNRDEFQTLATDPGHMKSRAYLPLNEITYAERLQQLGYYTYHIGKWHLGHEPYYPIHQGFDAQYGTCEWGHPKSYYQPFFKTENPFPEASKNDYLTDMLTNGAVDFIKGYNNKKPFLLNLWYYSVHGPQIGRKDFVKKYLEQGLSKIDAEYAGMIDAMDESVGRIRKAIHDKGLDDNTIFIFLSDQGGAFKNGLLRGGKRGGETLCEGGSRVPMIIYYPGLKANGKTIDTPVESIDIYPTLVEMASGKACKDKQINGVSLVPALNGGTLKPRNLYLYRSYEDQNSAIIKGDMKLIKYRSGKTLLFNIKNDMEEQNDLSKVKPELTQSMLKELLDWEKDATPKELLN